MSPWLPFGVFGAPLASLGATLGSIWSLWGPLGSLWDPFGSLWGPFGSLWGSIWLPWGALGALGSLGGLLGLPRGILGSILGFCQKRASNSGPMALISASCRQKLASRYSSGDSPDPPHPGEVRLGRQLANPLPRAGG